MFTIAICDDTPLAAEHIEKLLKDNDLVAKDQHIAKFLDPFALAFYLEKIKGQLDIILMDILLGEENGIAFAIRIGEKYPHIKIIFITGYIEYARTMMDAHPVYFLTKPVEVPALQKAMNAARDSLLREPSQTVSISVKGSIINISVRDILFIESSKRVVTIHALSASHTVYAQLRELAERLPPVFCHCHKSFIVNLNKVKHMDKKAFRLIGGQEVPISQTKYKAARAHFTHWLGEQL